MTWVYSQTSGKLFNPDGTVAGIGYSGHGAGKNCPSMQDVPNVGCIPQGFYVIGDAFTDGSKGTLVMRLTPAPDTQTFGRDGFLMHGDNSLGNQSASDGCIIQPHNVRQSVADSDDADLRVVA